MKTTALSGSLAFHFLTFKASPHWIIPHLYYSFILSIHLFLG